MQVLLSNGDQWEMVEVALHRGSIPCIGGTTLDQQQLETALWFKVLVLDVVSVDCSSRVISWTVKQSHRRRRRQTSLLNGEGGAREHTTSAHSAGCSPIRESEEADQGISSVLSGETDEWRPCVIPEAEPTSIGHSVDLQYGSSQVPGSLHSSWLSPEHSSAKLRERALSLSLSTRTTPHRWTHSFMAAHDNDSTHTCSDDLQQLFELALSLLSAESAKPSTNIDTIQESKGRSELWLQFIHCYLLPVLTVYQEDLPAVRMAKDHHQSVLLSIDQDLESLSARIALLKEGLNEVLAKVQSSVNNWVHYDMSSTFIFLIMADLKFREQQARAKIQSYTRNIEYSEKHSLSISSASISSATTRNSTLTLPANVKSRSLSPTTTLNNPAISLATIAKSPGSEIGGSPSFSSASSAGHLEVENMRAKEALFSMLQLRSKLVEAASHSSNSQTIYNKDSSELQMEYIKLHSELDHVRRQMSSLTSNKVLALSVREAIEHTIASLQSGCATSGMDVGRHGGSSTDVLYKHKTSSSSEVIVQSHNNTLRDAVQELLQTQTSSMAILHSNFCGSLKVQIQTSCLEWLDSDRSLSEFVKNGEVERSSREGSSMNNDPTTSRMESGQSIVSTAGMEPGHNIGSPTEVDSRFAGVCGDPKAVAAVKFRVLSASVKQHLEKVAEEGSAHFNNRGVDFFQKMWLCYERLFFEEFSEPLFKLCMMDQTKYCQQLMINAISVSMVNPRQLDLGVANESWLDLFPGRQYQSAHELYEEIQEGVWSLGSLLAYSQRSPSEDLPCMDLFGGVVTDLQSLVLALSPLDKLQLMTSAFRKASTALAALKLQTSTRTGHEPNSSVAAVSCDDILPVLVLLLLQWSPWLLALVHINCCILTDFIAPFLSSGWHGYSLAAFTSAVVIIKKL